MSKVIAIFGAGTGLGVSVARHFGREGFRVALVARRKGRLDALVAELADEGIEAAAFPADLTDVVAVPALVESIRAHFGRIDVVQYAPIGLDLLFTPAAELSGERLRTHLDLLTVTPVTVVQAVLPEMIERGDGAILVTHGFTAAHPVPNMSGLGPAMAATRNYLFSLHGEVADKGVYVGTLIIGAVIERSDGHQAITSGEMPLDLPEGTDVPFVDPDELAAQYWDMYTKRDAVERANPAEGVPAI
ncbi:SDR family NAD(P)-dependent oxidoreductase [Streptomyces sp. NPDC060223]|uniref:SDR family NAD(P)-dependent oxidoreductase n=1 Tax=unclassified Streptomyces TaxID=2593676 RepID=UPI00363EA28A